MPSDNSPGLGLPGDKNETIRAAGLREAVAK